MNVFIFSYAEVDIKFLSLSALLIILYTLFTVHGKEWNSMCRIKKQGRSSNSSCTGLPVNNINESTSYSLRAIFVHRRKFVKYR